MKAVILAAGKGERLEPITHTRPKPLIPILDKPLLIHMLERLSGLGIKEAIIVVGYMRNKIEEVLREYSLDIKTRLVVQDNPLGTGHALKIVEGLVKDLFLLIYGDILVSPSAIKELLNKGSPSIMLTRVTNPQDYGVVVTSNDTVKDIIEKPSKDLGVNTINAGVYLLDESIFNYLDNIGLSERGEYELTDALKLMLKDNVKLKYSIANVNEWFEIGKPWDLLSIHEKMLSKLSEQIINGEVEDYVKVKGPVIIEEGAVIRSGTYIIGPAYIGKGAIIGPNSYIRPYTVIGRNSRIGNAVEVKNSTLMEGVHAQHLTYIGDSIVCEYVNLGAGTITANLRFDNGIVKVTIKGKRISSGRRKLGAIIGGFVKTGINVSIMPGIKIGAYSWIAPGAVVNRDVPPKSFLKVDTKYYIEQLT